MAETIRPSTYGAIINNLLTRVAELEGRTAPDRIPFTPFSAVAADVTSSSFITVAISSIRRPRKAELNAVAQFAVSGSGTWETRMRVPGRSLTSPVFEATETQTVIVSLPLPDSWEPGSFSRVWVDVRRASGTGSADVFVPYAY